MFSRVVSNIRKRTKKSKDKDKSKLTASKSSPSFRLRPSTSKKRDFDGVTTDWYTTNDEESETDNENMVQSKSMTIIPLKAEPKSKRIPSPNSPPSHPTSLPLNRKFCDELVNCESNTSSNNPSSINLCSLNFSFADDEDMDGADEEGAVGNAASYDYRTIRLNKISNTAVKNAQEGRTYIELMPVLTTLLRDSFSNCIEIFSKVQGFVLFIYCVGYKFSFVTINDSIS